MTTESMITSTYSLYDLLSDKYSDELFVGILDSIKPTFSALPYIKRKHQSYKFRALMRIKQILAEKQEKILPKLLEVLPVEARKEAYLQAKYNILKILNEELKDVMEELDELMNIINKHELERSLRIDIKKQISILELIRDNISEEILTKELDDETIDAYLTIDQAISLLIHLYMKILEKGVESLDLSLYTLILNLRLMAILHKKDKKHLELLKEDIIEIAPELTPKSSPEEIAKLLQMVY